MGRRTRCSETATPLGAGDVADGASKQRARIPARRLRSTDRVECGVGRNFFTYGPHEHPSRLVPSVVNALLAGQPARCSAGTQARDFLFVEDVAAAFVALLESHVEGAVNIGSGVPVRIQDVVWQIADLLAARDLVRVGVLAAPGEPDLLCADVTRLTNEVGVTPRYTLASGLESTIEWWKSRRTPSSL